MKKSLLWRVAATLVTVVMSVGLLSCGDDVPAPSNQETTQKTDTGTGAGTETTQKATLVGTWKYSWGNGNYYRLTFNGTNESGTVKVETSWDGRMNTSTYNYTYRNSVLSLGSYKDIDVIRLTSDVLVLTDFPFEEECTYTRESNNPAPSLVGTWVYLLGDEGYFRCTFTGDGTSGTLFYEVNEKGKVEKESINYIYAAGHLTLYEGKHSEIVEVISLTATELVLKDWPDGGNCTFYKQ